ncbi:MAG: hypothetical protein HPY53_16985 [Brevinematales bacterium]|nr:hypothetical protein [Brevinematales bacterium]
MEYQFLEEFNSINEAGVQYLISGGLALNLHDVQRLTLDLDIILEYSDDNCHKAEVLLSSLGYHIDEVKEKKVEFPSEFIHKYINNRKVSLYPTHPTVFEEYYKRRIVFQADNLTIPTVSFNDLLEIKTKAGGSRNESDVHYLKMSAGAKLTSWPSLDDPNNNDWGIFNSEEYILWEFSKWPIEDRVNWLGNEFEVWNSLRELNK